MGRRPGEPARDGAAAGAWQRLSAGPGAKGHRWYDWALLALAFLTVAVLAEHDRPPPAGLIPLIRNEIVRLAAALIIRPAGGTRYRLSWSAWRRRHQRTAQACHYRRQAARDP
jgi:hypothetical protein